MFIRIFGDLFLVLAELLYLSLHLLSFIMLPGLFYAVETTNKLNATSTVFLQIPPFFYFLFANKKPEIMTLAIRLSRIRNGHRVSGRSVISIPRTEVQLGPSHSYVLVLPLKKSPMQKY